MRTDEEKIEVTQLIQALAAQFRVECDVPLFLGYTMALEELSIDEIRLAIGKACRESKFMPTGAELRTLAGVQSPASRALIAWNVVKGAIQTVGAYCSVDFDDPVTNATLRTLGGWVAVCDTPAVDQFDKFLRKEFERVYCELWKTGVSEEMARPHIGLSDQSNSANGFGKEIREPARIACGLTADESRVKRLENRKPVQKAISKLAGALTVSDVLEDGE